MVDDISITVGYKGFPVNYERVPRSKIREIRTMLQEEVKKTDKYFVVKDKFKDISRDGGFYVGSGPIKITKGEYTKIRDKNIDDWSATIEDCIDEDGNFCSNEFENKWYFIGMLDILAKYLTTRREIRVFLFETMTLGTIVIEDKEWYFVKDGGI